MPQQVSPLLEIAFTTEMFLATLTQKSIAMKILPNGEFAHIVELSSTLMTLVEYLSWATMSAALETSLQGTRWFTKAEIQSIVRATFLGVLLDTGTVGTTPLTTLLTSTTSSCSGLRFLSAITVSTSTRLWLVIGPSPNLIAIEAKDQAQPGRILSERFRALLLLLQASTTQDKNTDYDQVNRYCDGGRPDIPL